MKNKMKQSKTISLWVSLLLVGLVALAGCKKSEPPAPSESETTEAVAPSLSEAVEAAKSSASEATEAVVAKIEQTTCPIMGSAIDKAIFTEYQGKKVYFCCPGCEEKFKEEPEKYLAKLPQFKK